MSIHPTRSRRKEARPAEIIAAALASFAERGYAATKLEDVAAAAGISKGTIYLYFPTKEDLFRAVVRQAVLPNVEAAEANLASHTGSSADMLRMLAQRFLLLLDSDLTAVPKLVLAESGNFPAIAQFYADTVLRRAFRLVEDILTRGMQRGEFRQMDVHATLPLFAGPFLLLALWKHSLGRHTDLTFDPRAVADAHIGVLLRGLAPDKPS
jgi:AcrR family transcriptional regulator